MSFRSVFRRTVGILAAGVLVTGCASSVPGDAEAGAKIAASTTPPGSSSAAPDSITGMTAEPDPGSSSSQESAPSGAGDAPDAADPTSAAAPKTTAPVKTAPGRTAPGTTSPVRTAPGTAVASPPPAEPTPVSESAFCVDFKAFVVQVGGIAHLTMLPYTAADVERVFGFAEPHLADLPDGAREQVETLRAAAEAAIDLSAADAADILEDPAVRQASKSVDATYGKYCS